MTKTTSILPSFYLSQARDNRGRSIEQIWAFSDDLLENTHDYIQWLFPLKEPSQFNSSAPILDDAAIAEFRADEELQKRLLKSFQRMLKFYGLQLGETRGRVFVTRSSEYPEKSSNWLNPGNHNFLRITRILTSLNLLGLESFSAAFLTCLEQIYAEEMAVIGPTTIRYWRATADPR